MKSRNLLLIMFVLLPFVLLTGIAFAASPDQDNGFEPDHLIGTMQIDGETYIYEKGVWMTEDEYLSAYPEANKELEFWTVDEFSIWMEQEKEALQKLVGTHNKFYDSAKGEMREWTQQDVDTVYALWQAQLEKMKEGYRYAKPNKNLVGEFEPYTEGDSSPGSTVITLPNGESVDLGHYESAEAAQEAVKEYLDEQVKAGGLTRELADMIFYNRSLED